jgi:predicted DNA-binding ribbon-helix-helix protein
LVVRIYTMECKHYPLGDSAKDITKVYGDYKMNKTSTKVTQETAVEDSHKSTLVSRNITISGRRTSVRLEPEMWASLSEIAKREKCTTHDVCSVVALRKKQNTSLTAAIRVFIMLYFRAASTEGGHERAGHGNFESMRARARMADSKPAAPTRQRYWPSKGYLPPASSPTRSQQINA